MWAWYLQSRLERTRPAFFQVTNPVGHWLIRPQAIKTTTTKTITTTTTTTITTKTMTVDTPSILSNHQCHLIKPQPNLTNNNNNIEKQQQNNWNKKNKQKQYYRQTGLRTRPALFPVAGLWKEQDHWSLTTLMQKVWFVETQQCSLH